MTQRSLRRARRAKRAASAPALGSACHRRRCRGDLQRDFTSIKWNASHLIEQMQFLMRSVWELMRGVWEVVARGWEFVGRAGNRVRMVKHLAVWDQYLIV